MILVGLPGSGKTSFFQSRFAATHDHVSKDLLLSARDKGARQIALLEDALRAGRNVMVDNTNPRVVYWAPLEATARRHGAQVLAQVVTGGLPELLKGPARHPPQTERSRFAGARQGRQFFG